MTIRVAQFMLPFLTRLLPSTLYTYPDSRVYTALRSGVHPGVWRRDYTTFMGKCGCYSGTGIHRRKSSLALAVGMTTPYS
jgi:hypothetical protein